MQFYDNFVRLCAQSGKSLAFVAREIGVQKSTVSRWATGSVPRDTTLVRIADYFGITVAELIGEAKPEVKENATENDMGKGRLLRCVVTSPFLIILGIFTTPEDAPTVFGLVFSLVQTDLVFVFRIVLLLVRQPLFPVLFVILALSLTASLGGVLIPHRRHLPRHHRSIPTSFRPGIGRSSIQARLPSPRR